MIILVSMGPVLLQILVTVQKDLMVQDAVKVWQYFIYNFGRKNAKELIKQLLTALDTSVIMETKNNYYCYIG